MCAPKLRKTSFINITFFILYILFVTHIVFTFKTAITEEYFANWKGDEPDKCCKYYYRVVDVDSHIKNSSFVFTYIIMT